jgi:hypothetical protein
LLALMAWRHRKGEGGALPEKRQLLYEKSVEHLIDLWQREKPLYDAEGRIRGKEYGVFTELGISPERLREALNQLAYEAHRDQPSLEGTHDITVDRLAGLLFDKASSEGKNKGLQRIIEYVTRRTGMLIEREQGKIYRFPHRTFQEYLAACYLSEQNEFPEILRDRLREDEERWREAALLAAAKVSGIPRMLWTLVEVFCSADWPPPKLPEAADWHLALRAAQALIETEKYVSVPERQRPLMERLRAWLAQLLDSPTALAEAVLDRAEAGRALAVLGDPRPGVTVSPGPISSAQESLPAIRWVAIPGTQEIIEHGGHPGFEGFKLGQGLKSDPEFQDEAEQWPTDGAVIHIDPFQLAAYPVTVAQFRLFVESDGYTQAATGLRKAGVGASTGIEQHRPIGTSPIGVWIIIRLSG